MDATALLLLHITAERLPKPTLEFRFTQTRRFRADLAWPDAKLLCEVDGATWSGGRHVRGKGFESDCVKSNLATELGYRVLRFTTNMVKSGAAIRQLKRILGG